MKIFTDLTNLERFVSLSPIKVGKEFLQKFFASISLAPQPRYRIKLLIKTT